MTGLHPYQRILRAAKAGRGIRLSASECREIAKDEAVIAAAHWMDNPEDEHEHNEMRLDEIRNRNK